MKVTFRLFWTVNHRKTCTDVPVLVIRGMDFGGLYTDVGTDNQAAAIQADAKKIVVSAVKGLFGKRTFFSDFHRKNGNLLCPDHKNA